MIVVLVDDSSIDITMVITLVNIDANYDNDKQWMMTTMMMNIENNK